MSFFIRCGSQLDVTVGRVFERTRAATIDVTIDLIDDVAVSGTKAADGKGSGVGYASLQHGGHSTEGWAVEHEGGIRKKGLGL